MTSLKEMATEQLEETLRSLIAIMDEQWRQMIASPARAHKHDDSRAQLWTIRHAIDTELIARGA
jgi:hypothetical protein